ncbi:MAG TPA: ABC transporter permease, partial [Rectinemataceae bacterium]|nr:ABC transporter permease [Rectinemataceae bacterium]
MAWMVDRGIAAQDLGLVLRYGAFMLAVTAVGAIGSVGRNIIASRVSWDFASRLRSDLFRATLSMGFGDLGRFDEASLVTRQTNDVTQVQAFVNGMMRIFAKAPIIGVGSVVMAALLEPRLAPVFLVVVPLASVVIWINLRTGFGRFGRVQVALDKVSGRVREFLSGVRLVKAWGREEREERLFASANGELADATTYALRVMALLGPVAA